MAHTSVLSDVELNRKLTELGYTPGPITDSTRETYRLFYQKKAVGLDSTSHALTTAKSSKQIVPRGGDVSPPKTPPLLEQEPPLPEESGLSPDVQDSGISKCSTAGTYSTFIASFPPRFSLKERKGEKETWLLVY